MVNEVDITNKKFENNFLYMLWVFMGVPFIASMVIIIGAYFYILTHNVIFIYIGIFLGLTFERFIYCHWYLKKKLKKLKDVVWDIIVPSVILSIFIIGIFDILLEYTELQNVLLVLSSVIYLIPIVRYYDIFFNKK